MENRFLIDLSVKYGLNSEAVSKIVSIIYQCGIPEVDSREAKRVGTYLCEMNLLETPNEEIIEELKRKELI
jgi:hypothetical protein